MTESSDPAFPIEARDSRNEPWFRFGLSKREYFAAMAIQGMLAGSQGLNIKTWEFAEQSLALADSLISELNRTEDKKHDD